MLVVVVEDELGFTGEHDVKDALGGLDRDKVGDGAIEGMSQKVERWEMREVGADFNAVVEGNPETGTLGYLGLGKLEGLAALSQVASDDGSKQVPGIVVATGIGFGTVATVGEEAGLGCSKDSGVATADYGDGVLGGEGLGLEVADTEDFCGDPEAGAGATKLAELADVPGFLGREVNRGTVGHASVPPRTRGRRRGLR